MSRSKQPLRSDKPSIKYKCTLLDGASFELATFDDHTPTSSGSTEQKERKSEANSSQILSTAELISAVGQIWNWANGPLPFLQPKTNLRHYADDSPEGHIFCYSRGKGNGTSSTSSEIPYFPGSLMTTGHALPIVHPKIEFLNVSKKISFFEAHNGNFTHSLFGSLMQHGSNSVTNFPKEFWKEKSPATLGFSYDSRNLYEWMSEVSLPALTKRLNSTMVKNKMTDECCLSGDNPTSCCNLDNTSTPANNLAIGSAQSHAEITKCMDSSSDQSSTAVENASTTSLCSVYYLETVQTIEARSNNLKIPVPRVHTDYYLKNLASDNLTYEECQQKNEDANPYENKKNSHSEFIAVGKSELEVCSPTNTKPHYGLAKQEHAFAGALAGIFVSLCLHPVDTVKTVIQSCAAERPINSIVRSIISERGVTGLYRGIASNIASSAPISAVYTFTYESVKGALLPLFPIEYRSFAHCMGGGCASIATSFIFTPSERIKQQMQVGSHYQNCWKAVVGVIRKGGLPSLYAGWGAVLCRNVPHSVIKLVCGGLAGSTAALFTTPFDVVKTRLQTQIPGSIHQYDGVLNTLVEISKHEGLKGLYRGLIPRLVMYMSQGAIFFASYESFKRLFCMEVPQIYARTIELVQNMEDEEAS